MKEKNLKLTKPRKSEKKKIGIELSSQDVDKLVEYLDNRDLLLSDYEKSENIGERNDKANNF